MLGKYENVVEKSKLHREFFHGLLFWSFLLYFPGYTGLELLIYLSLAVILISVSYGNPQIELSEEFLVLMLVVLVFSLLSTLKHLIFFHLDSGAGLLNQYSIGYAPKILRSIFIYILAGIYIKHFKFGEDFLIGMCVAMFLGSVMIIIQVLHPEIQYITGHIFQYAQITSGSFTEPQRGHGLSNSSDVASMISAYLGIFLCCFYRSTTNKITSKILIFLIFINTIAAIFSARVGFILGLLCLFLSSKITTKIIVYSAIFFVATIGFLKVLIAENLVKSSFLYNFERSLDFSRMLNEGMLLIELGLAQFSVNNIVIGNGVLPYVGPNRLLGDMQYGQLLSGIGFLGTFALVLAVILPTFSFVKKKKSDNNLDVTAVICVAFLTLFSSIKGPYLLSRPLFDIFIVVLVFFSGGGSFSNTKMSTMNNARS